MATAQYSTDPYNTNYDQQPDPTQANSSMWGNVAQAGSQVANQLGNSPAAAPAQQGYVGHDDAYNGMTRDQYRDAWQGSGAVGLDGLRNFLGQHGGTLQADNGTVMTPWGEQLDMMIGAKTGHGTPGWGAAPGMQGYGTAPGAPGSGQGSIAGTINGGVSTSMDAQLGPYRDAMLAQLSKLQQPVSASDPSVSGAIGAFNTQSQRGLEGNQQALAERGYATGALNGGGFDQLQQQAREHAAAGQSQFAGNIVNQAQGQRDQMLNQLLGMGNSQIMQGNQLGFDYAGLAQNQDQFGRKLAQDNNQFQGQLGYNYANLGQQDNHFNDQMGYNYANLQAQSDRDALMAALGGGQ